MGEIMRVGGDFVRDYGRTQDREDTAVGQWASLVGSAHAQPRCDAMRYRTIVEEAGCRVCDSNLTPTLTPGSGYHVH